MTYEETLQLVKAITPHYNPTITGWAKVDSRKGSTCSTYEHWRVCPICGANDERVIQEQPGFQFFSDADIPKRMTLRDVQCQRCFALYRNPCYSRTGMNVLFTEAGRSYGHGTQAQGQVEWLKTHGLLDGRRSVLDYGCGSGKFLSCMPQDWQRLGVEPDEPSAITASEHGRIFQSWTLPDELTADLITLWHVLEHVPDPVATLMQLRALATDKTRLVVEVPILEMGATPDVTGFFSPQHVTHFSEWSLRAALCRAGWRHHEWTRVQGYNGFRIVAQPDTPAILTGEPTDRDILACYVEIQGEHTRAAGYLAYESELPCRVIWGAGLHTETLYQRTSMFSRHPEREYLIVDSDPLKQGTTWRGIHVYAPDALNQVVWNATSATPDLLVSSYGDQDAIRAAARAYGVPSGRIVTLYEKPRSY